MVDIASDTTTTAVITVGGSFTDQLEVVGDRDWIRIDLAAGQYVQITLEGSGASPVDDTYLRVYDSNSNLVAENDDINYPTNTNSSLVLSGGATGGTFYIEAASYFDTYAGQYTITTAEVEITILDSLDWGASVSNPNITVYFAPSGTAYDGVTSEGFNAYEIQQFNLAFDVIESYTNVTFTVVNDPNADFRLVLDTNELDPNDALAYFYPPGQGTISGIGVYSGQGWDRTAGGSLERGGDGFATVVHELLHGLGLAHPHDNGGSSTVMNGVTADFGDYGDYDLNQNVYTMQSYNRGWDGGAPGSAWQNDYGGAGGPMALDIALLQQFYGANASTGAGNTIYTLPDSNSIGTYWTSIWDTSGTDEIRYTGSRDVTIDLRAALIDYAIGGGGFISTATGVAGGFTIAQNVVIENASGGSGNDTITGNDAANTLVGGAGHDQLSGGGGSDTAIFEAASAGFNFADAGGGSFQVIDTFGALGTDTLMSIEMVQFTDVTFNVITGTANGETLVGTAQADIFVGDGGNDYLLDLGGGNDIMIGGNDNDQMQGSQGADRYFGGNGTDEVRYNNSNAAVIVNLGTNTATGGHAEGDTFDSIENLVGSQFADTLIGDANANRLEGFAGDDILRGGIGADVLYGDTGFDTADYSDSSVGVDVGIYRIGTGGTSQGDQLIYMERIIGSAHADTLIGGGLPLVQLDGGGGADLLFDYGGDSIINGGAGNDTMIGRLGADHFDGGDDIDVVRYADAIGGVNANLSTGVGTSTGNGVAIADAEGDTYQNVENLVGSIFNDVLVGDAGTNRLEGNRGRDSIEGGGGLDHLFGGDDIDTFVFNDTNWGVDYIYDFQDGLDKFDTTGAGLVYADFTVVDTVAGMRLDYIDPINGAQSIVLIGIDPVQISQADFV